MATSWNGPQPAPKAVWSLIHGNFPIARFLGIYNRRNVAGTSTPSAHSEGRALDIGLLVGRPREKALGDRLFQVFIDEAAEIGVHHVIWNQQIWSASRGGPRPYTGASPHTDHVHVAWGRVASQRTSFPRFMIALAVLRSALEDLDAAWRTTA